MTTSYYSLTGIKNVANSCANNRPCKPGTYCNASQCTACDNNCRNCSSTSISGCTQCYPSSIYYNQLSMSAKACVTDHVNFLYFQDPLTVTVPPSVQWRATMSFWFNIINVSLMPDVNFNFIYKDFMSIAIYRNPGTTNLSVLCIPIEYLYSIKGILTRPSLLTKLSSTLGLTLNVNYLSDTITSASSNWIFIKCAFSLDSYKYYLNALAEMTLPVPQLYSTQTNYVWFDKKFYRTTATTLFYMEGHSAISSSIYIKNVYVFREYMPQFMNNLKYL